MSNDGTVNESADPDQGESAIRGRLAQLAGRFGDRLSKEEWDKVRDAIAKQREKAARIRAVPLTNGDEPATTFGAGVGHG